MQFNIDIVKLAQRNTYYRRVIVTGMYSQVVLMSIPPGTDVGMETHYKSDQTLVFVAGEGKAIIKGEKTSVGENSLCFIPANTQHNIVNTGASPLKLYTIYALPQHAPGTVEKTKN